MSTNTTLFHFHLSVRTKRQLIVALTLLFATLLLLLSRFAYDNVTNRNSAAATSYDSSTKILSQKVFASTIKPCLTISQDELDGVMSSLSPGKNSPVPTLLHSLHLFGPDILVKVSHPGTNRQENM